MKIKYLLILSIIISSCSKKSDELKTPDLSFDEFPQKWSLYKTTGNLAGSETSGDDLEYQETYLFKADKTFIKTRMENEDTIEAAGTYQLKPDSETQSYLLEFTEENELIGNCSGDKTEYLYLSSDGNTLLSNWWACDGPGLFYKQVEIE